MNKKDKLELLKNRKQSYSLGLSTVVVLFIGLFTIINTILISTDSAPIIHMIALALVGIIWALRIRSTAGKYRRIDRAVFDTVKGRNTKEIEAFIKKEYDFEQTNN